MHVCGYYNVYRKFIPLGSNATTVSNFRGSMYRTIRPTVIILPGSYHKELGRKCCPGFLPLLQSHICCRVKQTSSHLMGQVEDNHITFHQKVRWLGVPSPPYPPPPPPPPIVSELLHLHVPYLCMVLTKCALALS